MIAHQLLSCVLIQVALLSAWAPQAIAAPDCDGSYRNLFKKGPRSKSNDAPSIAEAIRIHREKLLEHNPSDASQAAFELVAQRIAELYEQSTPAKRKLLFDKLANTSGEKSLNVLLFELTNPGANALAAVDRKSRDFYIPEDVYKNALNSVLLLHEFRHLYDLSPNTRSQVLNSVLFRANKVLLRPGIDRLEGAAADETARVVKAMLDDPKLATPFMNDLAGRLDMTPKERDAFVRMAWSKETYAAMAEYFRGGNAGVRQAISEQKIEEVFKGFSDQEIDEFAKKVAAGAVQKHPFAYAMLRDTQSVQHIVSLIYGSQVKEEKKMRRINMIFLASQLVGGGGMLAGGLATMAAAKVCPSHPDYWICRSTEFWKE